MTPGSRRASRPSRTSATAPRRHAVRRAADGAFGWLGAGAAALLAIVLATQAFSHGWRESWFVVVVYVVIAYLVLPRIHTALAAVYLPDYFIGRTRTREGILGDPVNVSGLGSLAQVHAAMLAAGWTLADDLGVRANLRIAVATLSRRSYPSAPVSNLFLFGRRQAFCYQQEVDGSPGKRHHVRFWATPDGWLLPGGQRVDWLAAATFDRSVGFSAFTWQVTHRIADDVDTERDHVVASVLEGSEVASASMLEHFSTGYHSRNGGGDAITTDGGLPVVDLRDVEVATSEVRLIDATAEAQTRPVDVVLATLLLAARPVAATVTIVAWLTGVDGRGRSADPVVVVVAVGLSAVVVLVWAAIAVGVFVGRSAARGWGLVLSTIAVVSAAVSWFGGHDDLTTAAGLAGFALDSAILFALSSAETRRWTADRRRRRRYSGRDRITTSPSR
ncbi:LssY C-terminal domain-containing protein [Curtobacterium sp. 9128]|uniref:LssY C-terminal domain-containing protein n=1 Tax=Curtobacterium sp. 9128 TaxID=1793722 RepID=UPI00164319CF|nr:LssY C-terminal domain-containing protein [Curtobacterium sp. 9128]